MISKKLLCLLLAAAPAAVLADENIGQRLGYEARRAERSQEQKVKAADAAQQARQAKSGGFQDTGEALYHAVNRNDWVGSTALLAEYERQPGHDPDLALFARAATARAAGEWGLAKKNYETLLQRRPDFTRGRLDLARLLYEGRLNREAESQFNIVAQQADLPESVKENIATFQTALNDRNSWRGSIQAGPVWSSNINESGSGSWCMSGETDGVCLGDEWEANPVEKGAGIRYEATASRRRQISGHHGLFVRSIGYGQAYRDQKQYGNHTFNLNAGYQYENHRHALTLTPVWEWHGSGGKTEYNAYGVRADWERNTEKWGWNTEIEWKRLNYTEGYPNLDGHMLSVNNTLSYTFGNNVMLFGGLDWQQRNASGKTNAYRQPSLRAGAVKVFDSGFDAAAIAVIRHRSYDDHDAALQARRRDNEQIYLLNVGAERWQIAGMKPVLNLKHRRNNSNVDWLHSYRQNEIGLALKKSF